MRCKAGNLQKRATQSCFRDAKVLSQRSEPHAFFFLGINKVSCCALDQSYGSRNLVWFATQTGTIALLLSFFSRAKESHIAPQRPSRRARRSAVNMGRADCKDERAIRPAV